MPPAIPPLELNRQELEQILERALTAPLAEDDYQKLHAVLDTLSYMTQLLENKNTTLERLRQIVFGASTEKTRQILQNVAGHAVTSSTSPATQEQGDGAPSPQPPSSDSAESEASPGHGRNGAQAYAGAAKVRTKHPSLKPGDRCPKCEKGKVYALATPGVVVRLVGQAPVAATVYELEKLRCNLCGEVFTAEPPARAGPDKYDATAASMIALLKYGSGLPFHRLQGLQGNLGTPLPASTQWEIVAERAAALRPACRELIHQAAQGEVLYNDDTTMKILALMGKDCRRAESEQTAAEKDDSERTGIFTTGVVSTREGHKIALFFTGRKHAGENLADVLAQRAQEMGPPIQMCDGLDRNLPKEFQTIVGNCLLHGRRKFVEVVTRFPDECRYLLETLREVYKHDAFCRQQGMSAEDRLAYHQAHSGPLMKTLEEWFDEQFAEVWILDETSFPKAGQHSVGVARQYCGALGKIANCQVAVSLHWSSTEASCPVVWRLYLPKEWLEDAARAAEVNLPPGTVYRTKTELALETIDQALAWGLPPRPVLADSAYGNDFSFRRALRDRHLQYAVQVEPTTVVWTEDPNLPVPAPKKKKMGRPRRYPPLEALPRPQSLEELAQKSPPAAWRGVTWRQGSRGAQRSRFLRRPVWAAHDWREQAHPPRVREWLLVEWPAGEKQPTKYWLAQLGPPPLGLRRFVRIAKARWRIEQDYRELKEELGLDHYEGRHWLGWHHHVCLVTLAYAFLRSEQSRLKKNFWCDVEHAPSSETTAGATH